jgi:hypothetical protein
MLELAVLVPQERKKERKNKKLVKGPNNPKWFTFCLLYLSLSLLLLFFDPQSPMVFGWVSPFRQGQLSLLLTSLDLKGRNRQNFQTHFQISD